MPKGCRRPKGPKNTVFCDFPPLGVRSVKTQNVKKLRSFREKLLGVQFFPPKVPLAPGNRVFLFSARNFSKCQGAALGQKGLNKPVFCDFPPLGVRSVRTQNAKKLRSFWEKLSGVRFFPPKVPLALGNRVLLFSAPNFSKCQGAALGQKGLNTQ